MNLLLIILLSLISGFAWKLGDLLFDDKLKWFKYSFIVTGIFSALSFVGLMYLDSIFIIHCFATVLYWFLRNKLECFSHSLGGVLTILFGTYLIISTGFPILNFYILLLYFLWITITGYIHTYIRENNDKNSKIVKFLRLRIRYYVAPALLSIYTGNYNLIISFIIMMAVTEAVTYWYSNYSKKVPNKIETVLGFS